MENELSLRLAELRKKNNLSQEALAEKLSVSRQAVSKWERGESAPDTENLIALSEIFGVTLDELAGKKGQDEKTDSPAPEESAGPVSRGERKKERRLKRRERAAEKPPMLFPRLHGILLKIPVILIVPAAFVLTGVLTGVWHPAWLMNLLIPVYYLVCHAFGARNRKQLFVRMPVFLLTVIFFLLAGFTSGWEKSWFVLLVNPFYYWIAFCIKK